MESTITQSIIETVSMPWHWAVAGIGISVVLFFLTWMGRKFGVSTTFEALCNLMGAGKRLSYFDFDIKDHFWRLAFVGGAIIGGIIASQFLASPDPVALSEATISHLENDWQINYPQGHGFLPDTLFNFGNIKGVVLTIIGGFLVGFGSRYGRGCTSGHAITGLAHFQLPSLITVVGFFIGGLAMTWIIMPLIFGQY